MGTSNNWYADAYAGRQNPELPAPPDVARKVNVKFAITRQVVTRLDKRKLRP